jgi:hypothetical protein
VAPALAANPVDPIGGFSIGISPGDIEATPEMWFYEQYLRQWQDPKTAVRQRAELKAAQRQQRMAARQWFGFSNARPAVAADPYHGDYSPRWSSNNGHYPFQWSGVGSPMVVLRPDSRSTY